ncbi:hypothetical protein [Actinosynnema sp. NPDC020468]|uniref:hypothetical protein n=1 Tax=Actinosynnema sp. NPDC020468 TaxID=3154488 RepID=UPI0033E1DCAE
MIRSRRLAALAVGLVVVLSGCSVRVLGTPVPVPNPTFPKPPEPTGANLFGDFRTLDPCGLLEPADLASVGRAALGPVESLDYCAFTVTTSAGAKLDLAVGILEQLESERELTGTKTPFGDFRIQAEEGDDAYCARRLVFPDLVTMHASVNNFGKEKTTAVELCGVVEAAVKAVGKRLQDGKEPAHRTFAANSLGRLDACEAVPAATIAKVPGLAAAKARQYPARHQCRWSKDGTVTPPRVRVTYLVDSPGANQAGSEVLTIAGRSTVVAKSAGTSIALCSAETAHVDFPGATGRKETAMVIVSLPSPAKADDACVAAKFLAVDVWNQLPK